MKHEKSIRHHTKLMLLKVKQDVQGDLLRHWESPGMIFDTARIHNLWISRNRCSQDVFFVRSETGFYPLLYDPGPGLNTGGTYVNKSWESESRIRHSDRIRFLKSGFLRVLPCYEDLLISNDVPWRRVLRTTVRIKKYSFEWNLIFDDIWWISAVKLA